MARATLRIGDICEIPLPSGKKGFAQYVHYDKNFGPVVQVYALVTDTTPSVDEILRSGAKFPPVITGVQSAVKVGLWSVIGHAEIGAPIALRFRNGVPDKTGKVQVWWLYDGERETRVGRLPPGAERYELLIVWAQDALAKRIDTGENPFASW